MHQRIRFSEDRRYGRIVARIPAGLEQACRRLSQSEGWELGDLYRCLIVLGACGSYLTLRPSEAPELLSDSDFAGVVDQCYYHEQDAFCVEDLVEQLETIMRKLEKEKTK